MLFALFVIQQRFARYALRQRFRRDRHAAVRIHIAVEHDHFERRKRRARVAVGAGGDLREHALRHRYALAAEPGGGDERPAEQRFQIGRFQRL